MVWFFRIKPYEINGLKLGSKSINSEHENIIDVNETHVFGKYCRIEL